MLSFENLKVFFDAKDLLGEGPIWDAANERILWVDILSNKIHSLGVKGNKYSTHPTPGMVGCVGLTDHGLWIAAVEHKVGLYDPKTDSFEPIGEVEATLPRNRFNDGKCAPDGGFILGSMDMDERKPNGALYRVSGKGVIQTLESGRTISNGIAWSPNLSIVYTIDTPTMRVMAYDYDPINGRIDNAHVAFEIPTGIGYPDGMTSDNAGNLWIAMWGGARITIWEPTTGKQIGELPVPALNPTCCIFGGVDNGTLFITSAKVGMSAEQLAKYPLSGSLFSVETRDVRGAEGFLYKE